KPARTAAETAVNEIPRTRGRHGKAASVGMDRDSRVGWMTSTDLQSVERGPQTLGRPRLLSVGTGRRGRRRATPPEYAGFGAPWQRLPGDTGLARDAAPPGGRPKARPGNPGSGFRTFPNHWFRGIPPGRHRGTRAGR